MGIEDRIDAAKDKLTGKTKEEIGKVTDDEQLEGEGKFDQIKGDLKEGVADVKDKVSDIADKLKSDDKR